MNLEYKFAKVPDEYKDQQEESHYFTIVIRPEHEDILLKDTCGRFIPLDINDVPAAIKALKKVRNNLRLEGLLNDKV